MNMVKDVTDIILLIINAGIIGYLINECIETKRKHDREKLLCECKELCKSAKQDIAEILKICEDMRNIINNVGDNDGKIQQ
ncbi:hypothetical protein [Clostridium sp. BL-8]|uniref:hypothetical protein n=1 Tax=Clostridium sp. BL-8 TaxID=349938 RepID=UPI00098CCD04|nr:hypothetical protein [Clostridium sp. BL-8]OOM76594.1 hypothetical protein CLOBL_34790 [Clostridium sp. BL-8]